MKVYIEVTDLETTPDGVRGRCALRTPPWDSRRAYRQAGLFGGVFLVMLLVLGFDAIGTPDLWLRASVATMCAMLFHMGVSAAAHWWAARAARHRVGRQLRDGGITLSGTALRQAVEEDPADG